MNFEKALEAMKQGKKVFRTCWGCNPICYLSIQNLFGEERIVICIGNKQRNFNRIDDYYQIPFDDWEIYEEPQKEPEMTAEKASKILDLILDYINVGEFEYITHCSFIEIAESVRLAIVALENQNQSKPEKKSKCGFNCKTQPAKFIPDDMPTEEYIRKLAFDKFTEGLKFDKFTEGLKFGLEIAKDLQEENENNA